MATTKKLSPRALETRMVPSAVYTGRGQFWSEICSGKHALHLKKKIEENYIVTTKWDRKRYIGVTLDRDYKQR